MLGKRCYAPGSIEALKSMTSELLEATVPMMASTSGSTPASAVALDRLVSSIATLQAQG